MCIGFVIALLVLGVLLLFIEVLLIPGTTFVGILGFLGLSYALFEAFATHGVFVGWMSVLGVLFFIAILIYFGYKTKTLNFLMLNTQLEAKASEEITDFVKVGQLGKTISRLSPVGKAIFNDKYYEVYSKFSMIEPHQEIEIVEISDNKIIVKLLNE